MLLDLYTEDAGLKNAEEFRAWAAGKVKSKKEENKQRNRFNSNYLTNKAVQLKREFRTDERGIECLESQFRYNRMKTELAKGVFERIVHTPFHRELIAYKQSYFMADIMVSMRLNDGAEAMMKKLGLPYIMITNSDYHF